MNKGIGYYELILKNAKDMDGIFTYSDLGALLGTSEIDLYLKEYSNPKFIKFVQSVLKAERNA